MDKEFVREDLIDIIEICRNCIRFIDEDALEVDPYLKYKLAIRLSSIDLKLYKVVKGLRF